MNKLLKGYRYIYEFEGHDQEFKELISGSYNSFYMSSSPTLMRRYISWISILEMYFTFDNWVKVSVIGHRQY
jgi:hypothetical protein